VKRNIEQYEILIATLQIENGLALFSFDRMVLHLL